MNRFPFLLKVCACGVLPVVTLTHPVHADEGAAVAYSSLIVFASGSQEFSEFNRTAVAPSTSGSQSVNYASSGGRSTLALEADYGVNRLFLSGTAVREQSSVNALGYSMWADDLTIDALGRTGQTGTLNASLNVDGLTTLQNVFAANENSRLAVNVVSYLTTEANPFPTFVNTTTGNNGTTVLVVNADNGFPDVEDVTFNFSVPFTYGTPFTFGVQLHARVNNTGSANFPNGVASPGSGSITFDFGNTVGWGGIASVLDNASQPVTTYTVSSESGTDYRNAIVPVPEPSTALMLLGAGLLVLVPIWRRLRC